MSQDRAVWAEADGVQAPPGDSSGQRAQGTKERATLGMERGCGKKREEGPSVGRSLEADFYPVSVLKFKPPPTK